MNITPKQERFCREYVIDLNGTQAAIRAGYSENTANEQAARLLANVSVQEFIAELQEKVAKKLEISAERVLQELAKIAFCDPRKLFEVDGALVNIRQMDDDSAAVISSIEVYEEMVGRGEEAMKIGETKKIKMWDKVAALEKLGKHCGIFERDNKQKQVIVNLPPFMRSNGK